MEITMTEVIVSCPSCKRPMDFRNDSWQCMACHPIPTDVPICKTQICKRPLTRLGEPWNCWICLRCNDHPDVVNKRKKEEEKQKRKYLDTKVTEDRVKEIVGQQITAEDVRQIVVEAMSEFMTKPEPDPDYPPAQAEIAQLPEVKAATAQPVRDWTWLQKAKQLGVKTHKETGGMRKKEEILADMEAKKNETVPEKIRTEEQAGSGGW